MFISFNHHQMCQFHHFSLILRAASWSEQQLSTICGRVLCLLSVWLSGKDWRQEEKGMTEEEKVGWHHRLDGHDALLKLWKLVMDRDAWHAAVHGITKNWIQLSDWTELACDWKWLAMGVGSCGLPNHFSKHNQCFLLVYFSLKKSVWLAVWGRKALLQR